MTDQKTLKIVEDLCGALAEEKVDYCHWKSNEALDRSASGDNDLDLLIGRAPAEFGKLMPLFIEHLEKDDPVARRMLDLEIGYIDTYVRWFKAHNASVMAIVGGFGERLFPILQQRYGSFVALPKFEPLHGAVILARQNFASN